MANPTYEIPAEMRDFAEKSVDQARKAFEGFMGAAHKAVGTIEGASSNVGLNAKDVSSKAMSFAQSNVTAAFDLAQKLVRAKDVQEVVALQTEYARTQVAAAQTQAKELGALVQTAAVAATKK